jgi:hypothetical protein
MIPVNALRIGNLVLVNDTVQKIISIDNSRINHKTACIGYMEDGKWKGVSCDDPSLQPVDITSERLQEYGFVLQKYFKLWQKARAISGSGMEMELDIDYNAVDFLRRPILKDIKSIHSLQNLYFALLTQELELQPPVDTTA